MPRDEISLNARWALAFFDEGTGDTQGVHLPNYDDSGWVDAVVPGDVHLDLMRAGKIADPFIGLNYLDCKWMEEKEWWYRREFSVPEGFSGRRVELQFGGLDCCATVWVNGELADKHCNMFVHHTIDISALLRYGHRNTVAVCLSSPIKAVEGKTVEGLSAANGTSERVHIRKAQMSYGWDIAPRVVTTGIWRPVYLVARGDLSIGDIAVRTDSISDGEAAISLEIPVRRNNSQVRSAELQIEIRSGRDGNGVIAETLNVKLTGREQIVRHTMRIPNPRLWWPWNVGQPDLYRLCVKAVVQGELAEQCDIRFGIRNVELVQEPQEDGGRSFIFAINGRRIFAKGTNWIPGDAIFARMSHKKYRELIDLALANNINMFRIWGGGIYEDPYFYRLCDEHGIMIWQDFMFACADYPTDEAFLEEVRYEAEKVVTALRNHPSIVIWCGDNEIDVGRAWSGMSILPNTISREVLPEVCARLDPTREYLWSSPCSPSGHPDPQNQFEGDTHLWSHGTSYKDPFYTRDVSRFISEIGHLSVPWTESVSKFIPEEHLWPPENKHWDFHFGTVERMDPQRRERVDWFIKAFGLERPDSLEEYAYVSQLIQALAYKEWIEQCRRRWPLCGGILYWNLYDNWPQFSDAAVDYYQNPKIAYYFVTRAFSNMLVSLQDLDTGMVGVWLVNDEPRDRTGKLLLRCQRFDGGTSWTRVLPVKLPAGSSRMAWDMRLPSPLMEDPCGCFAQAQLQVNGRIASENFYFPAECAQVEFPKTQLIAHVGQVRESGGRIIADVTVASRYYARLVRIETPGRHSILSDNFLDIPPGEQRTVRITTDKGPEPPSLRISAFNASRAIKLSLG